MNIIIIIIRLYSMHRVHKMQTIAADGVAWSVCLLVTFMNLQKQLNRSRYHFGEGLTHMGPRNCVLEGDQHRMNPFAAIRGDKSSHNTHQ